MAQLKDTIITGTLSVKGNVFAPNLHPVGEILITKTNESPASRYGGIWKLVDKEFKPTSVAGTSNPEKFFTKTSSIGDFSISYSRAGHSVRIRIDASVNTLWTYKTNKTLGTFNFPAFGFTNMPISFFDHPGGNNENYSVILADLIYSTGELIRKEIVRFAWESGVKAGTTIKGSTVHWDFPIIITNKDDMIDSFCDKFYWEKIK